MRVALAGLLLSLASQQAAALYFYIDGPVQKCFYEELPKDTLVVGHYKALTWSAQSNTYIDDPSVGIQITADEVFDNDHRVVNQRGANSGKLTFSAADSGTHRMCFTPSNVPSSAIGAGGIKFELDLAIGATSNIERSDKDKISEVAERVKDIVARLQDVRREQVFQREREAEFRDMSEHVNARVVKWTIIQMIVLVATCVWQLTYLRAFFIKQKLT